MSYGTVIQQGNLFRIDCKPLPKILAAVKELPERRFMVRDGEKYWTVPTSHRDEVIRLCKVHNLQFGHVPVKEETRVFTLPPMPELMIDIPLKNVTLRPYQRQGVAYGIEKKRFINGDDMGLGKTLQAIATTIALNQFPCLIICPSAVKENWKKAIEQFSYKKALVLSDSVKNTFPEFYRCGMADYFIVNYESLKKYFVESIKEPPKGKRFRVTDVNFKTKYVELFKSGIVDEIHKLKDGKTQAYKFTRGILLGKEVVMGLTGTAVVNKPIDLASQLAAIGRLGDLGGYNFFKEHFCAGPKEASNLKELNWRLNGICYFRRNKTDPEIKRFLPDKSRQIVMCDLSPAARKEYAHAQANLESYMKEIKQASDEQVKKSMKGEVMVKIGILKNISARGKLHDAFDFIHDIISQGQKIVVFAYLNDVVAEVRKKFPKSVQITGAENSMQKQQAVERFQHDPGINVIVCNLKAAGVGVDGLQNVATNVCFLEFGWHAAVMDQAEDRLYRTGQHSNVMCTYFLGKDTIDEWNYKLIESKREIANTITGAEDETEVSIIDNIMNLFSKE